MKVRIHYEIWQGGLVLGTIVLALGILRIFYPFQALPHSTILCFIGAFVAYFFSFFSFKKFNEIQNRHPVDQ